MQRHTAGHVMRADEVANDMKRWNQETRWRGDDPKATLWSVTDMDTLLNCANNRVNISRTVTTGNNRVNIDRTVTTGNRVNISRTVTTGNNRLNIGRTVTTGHNSPSHHMHGGRLAIARHTAQLFCMGKDQVLWPIMETRGHFNSVGYKLCPCANAFHSFLAVYLYAKRVKPKYLFYCHSAV